MLSTTLLSSSHVQATGVKKEYPGWTLGVAALLAVSSIIPMIVGAVGHFGQKLCRRNQKHSYDTGKFYRVDTTASTQPMLGDNYQVGGKDRDIMDARCT